MLHTIITLYEDGNKRLKPNIIVYNTVLNACAFTKNGDKNDALLVALMTFNELRNSKYCKPDAITYGTLLKSFNYLLPKGDKLTMMTTKLFHQCCKDGLYGDLFMNGMRKAVPKETFKELMVNGGAEWSKGNIRPPRDWIRNVNDRRSAEAAKMKKKRRPRETKQQLPTSLEQKLIRKSYPQIGINVGGTKASDLL